MVVIETVQVRMRGADQLFKSFVFIHDYTYVPLFKYRHGTFRSAFTPSEVVKQASVIQVDRSAGCHEIVCDAPLTRDNQVVTLNIIFLQGNSRHIEWLYFILFLGQNWWNAFRTKHSVNDHLKTKLNFTPY